MKQYNAKTIRNVALVGHAGSGKTSLAEAAFYLTGQSERLGRVPDGNTICDFDPEEIKRKASVSTALLPVEWKDTKINLLDTPGLFDFAGGMREGIGQRRGGGIGQKRRDCRRGEGIPRGSEKGHRHHVLRQ